MLNVAINVIRIVFQFAYHIYSDVWPEAGKYASIYKRGGADLPRHFHFRQARA